MNEIATFQLITDVEHIIDGDHTTAWIVPIGTALADARYEAETAIPIPASEDERNWDEGMRAALTAEGWTVAGEITQDGTVVTATVAQI